MITSNCSYSGKAVIATLALLLLSACATTPPLDDSDIDLALTPAEAVSHSEELKGHRVLWGGMIISAANLKTTTQIEILAYPLDSSQRPDTSKSAYGRFLAQHNGYLETAELSTGRMLTLSGRLDGTSVSMIGESQYTYPIVAIEKYHLWRRSNEPADSQVHFGVGVMLHN